MPVRLQVAPSPGRCRPPLARLGSLVVIGCCLRVWVLVASQRLSADEAIPGLMARHLLVTDEHPVFYWGQAYFGALESYLIAVLFGVFGFHAWLVFGPALLASVALIPLIWILGEHLGPAPAGLIAALPVAVPPPILARVLGNAGGGFALGFALQLAALLCAIRAAAPTPYRQRWLALFALTAGLAGWVWQPALVALPPLLVVLLWYAPELRRPRALACLSLALVGLAPPLAYNLQSGWPTLSALASKFGEQAPPDGGLFARALSVGHSLGLALGGSEETFGGVNVARALLLAASLVLAPIAVAWLAVRSPAPVQRQRALATAMLLTTTAIGTLAAHTGTRYLVPLVLAACGLFGALLALLSQRLPRVGRLGLGLATLACVAPNLAGYASIAERMAPEQLSQVDQTQTAIDELDRRALTTGYADYWTAYPIAYLSAERIVVAPSLPFAYSGRVDRYPPYTALVDNVDIPERLFLLVDRRCPAQPYLDALVASGATYRADVVARWLLIWEIHAAAGAESTTLAGLRATLAAQQTC
jgi:hypothetical protein